MKDVQPPPKPSARTDKRNAVRLLKLFKTDILSALPAKLYHAWMAEFKAPFFKSYFVNDPKILRLVLRERPESFPKSDRMSDGLRPLLGNSVFLTNGTQWKRQRRIIDPAFEGGRLREIFPSVWQAAEASAMRLIPSTRNIEPDTSHAAADVIFRALFSLPIEDGLAQEIFEAFQEHQRAQPMVNLGSVMRLPEWMPRFHSRKALKSAQKIHSAIANLVERRANEIDAGQAPDDLATKIMSTPDPETGDYFTQSEMVDQVATFFLAGHETSASALAWALYLLAENPVWQEKVAQEAQQLTPDFSTFSKLRITRDVFRETLRLYPPVPMTVRENIEAEEFRGRKVVRGSQIIVSPWHVQRHERIWPEPDHFNPDRWQDAAQKEAQRDAYLPFSAGARVCVGAGFAMMEGTLMLAMLVRKFRFEPVEGRRPVPIALLTLRGKDGVWVKISKR